MARRKNQKHSQKESINRTKKQKNSSISPKKKLKKIKQVGEKLREEISDIDGHFNDLQQDMIANSIVADKTDDSNKATEKIPLNVTDQDVDETLNQIMAL
eukprot:Seg554.2 transcript_id=Seg554.2/GoldUCD/mRNA.D3Y31 product="hypothetical protein" protein_id=Seg554.2/GoldUCD/D3Y31